MYALAILLLLDLAACGRLDYEAVSPPPRDASVDGDATGDTGGRDSSLDAGPCASDPPPSCEAEKLTRCTADGTLEVWTCPLGCFDSGRCTRPAPSNVGDFGGFDGLADVTTEGTWILDTDTGEISTSDGGTVRPPGEGVLQGIAFRAVAVTPTAELPDLRSLGVFETGSLSVPSSSLVVGVGDRALVLLVERQVVIEGAVSVAVADVPDGRSPAAGHAGGLFSTGGDGFGPGGGRAGMPAGGGDDGGGGGGAHGSPGASGGNAGAGAGGVLYGEEALEPLTGGSGGGHMLNQGDATGWGGHGGGALQITAGLSIEVRGRTDASGGGGGGGVARAGGGGGGAGGGILLEAPTVGVDGFVGANGGAGGQGGGNPGGIAGTDGADGSADPSLVPALGVKSMTTGMGNGGDGSDLTGIAEAGGGRTQGGGGGGGAGRIRINTLASALPASEGLTPDPDSGLVTAGPIEIEGR